MNSIKMVDLQTQYLEIKPEIDKAIQNVLTSTQFIKGSAVKLFEENFANYLNVKHVIGCGNGTDALQLALMSLDLEPGDEIITSNFTFIATAEVIALLKLKPVLVDVDSNTFNIDVKQIKKAITPKTKVIIPVHLFGQASPMSEIMAIAKENKLFVIEDTAQATGSEYISPQGVKQKLGTMGTMGCTSFFPSKNLGAFGDGGAVFTNDDRLAEKLRILANHGMRTRYYHDYIGINSRLDGIQAAILNVKLPKLDAYNLARQKAADFYDKAFANCTYLQTPYRSKNSTHIFHQYTLIIKERRDELKEFLTTKEIPAMIYYPVPLNKQKAFAEDFSKNMNFPITEKLSETVLSLPMHTELSNEQLEYITSNVIQFFKTN